MTRINLIFALFISLFTLNTYADCTGMCRIHKLNPIIDREEIIRLANLVKQATDSREVFSENSPEFLESYGKIFVNGAQRCTGNIVTHNEDADSYYVTTAAHCFRNNEEDNARITIEFTKRDGTIVRRNLSTHKINKKNDYAIMELDAPIKNSNIKPLVVADYNYDEIMITDYDTVNPYQITYAGYSSDKFKGDEGRHLTYDQKCKFLPGQKDWVTNTDCVAYPGASGGALTVSVTDRDNHNKITHYFVGVNHSISYDPYAEKRPQVATFIDHGAMYEDLMEVLE